MHLVKHYSTHYLTFTCINLVNCCLLSLQSVLLDKYFRESEGEFEYGNYRKEADDLHSVVSYLCKEKYDVTAIVGHSKGR